MIRVVMLVVLAGMMLAQPGAAQEPRPPLPSPRVPPGAVELAPIPPPPPLPPETAPAARAGNAARKPKAERKTGPPRIVLGEKNESAQPTWSGAGVNKAAKLAVKASGGTLTASLAGVADSHAFWGIHSTTFEPIQLVQQFEIVPGDPDDRGVMVAFSGKLGGYVRTEKHSAAALRQADAIIYPVNGGPSITIGFTPCSASEGTATACVGDDRGEPQLMPAGRYVLTMNLVLETSAGGVFRGHSVAVFAPGFNAGEWRVEAEEIADLEDAGFGFSITVKATPADSD